MGVLGVHVRDPNSQEKSDAGTNRSAIIATSVRGGPAYKADLVAEDLVLAVNNEGVDGIINLVEKIKKFRGQLTTFKILRKRKTIHKQIQLNN
jgi:S1-C subfamily serine protease